MRLIHLLTIVSTTTLNSTQECSAQTSPSRYQQIENIKFENEFFDQIKIFRNSILIAGSFDSVVFIKNLKTVFTIHDGDGYDTISKVFKGVSNLVNSDLLFISKLNDGYFLSLFGFEYGCCPRKLTLIRIRKEGFMKIFDKNLDVWEISKISDNFFLINGRPVVPQGLFGNDSISVGGYAPNIIYKLTKKLEIDSVQTINWNKENYVFRGFKSDYDIWVAQPSWKATKNIKSYVFKEKNAEPPKIN